MRPAATEGLVFCMMNRLLLPLLLSLLSFSAASAEDYVFSCATARLVLSADGTVASLTQLPTQRSLLSAPHQLLASVTVQGQKVPLTAITRTGDSYRFTFGNSGVTAQVAITPIADAIVFELQQLRGSNVQSITLAQFSTALPDAGGTLLAVRSDNLSALALLGLTENVQTAVGWNTVSAALDARFGWVGGKVALLATPTSRFTNTVQELEQRTRLFTPQPLLDGVWSKDSPAASSSYLFVDLTEANVDQMIAYAKMAGAQYLLIYSTTWSLTSGSYALHPDNYPHGEQGLKDVIAKCHAAGLRVGMHMMTAMIRTTDPLVRPRPTHDLLKTAQVHLTAFLSAEAIDVPAAMPAESASILPADLQIEDEILRCAQQDAQGWHQCQRGFSGTRAQPHAAGVSVARLAGGFESYLVDLHSPTAAAMEQRIAGLINRVGFDMIYFDGGDLNAQQGPFWHEGSVFQTNVWKQLSHPILVQGSGITPWSWHLFTRATCDDFAAVAVKQYLDNYKIRFTWQAAHKAFLPAELGWVGILQGGPDHFATTPDELELVEARSLGLNSGLGVETDLASLRANGRSEEILSMMGRWERLRRSGTLTPSARQCLLQGEWHITGAGQLLPVQYRDQQSTLPGPVTLALPDSFPAQPLKFRARVEPNLAPVGAPANIVLFRAANAAQLSAPDSARPVPGQLLRRTGFASSLNLASHRALAAVIEVQGAARPTPQAPVLNLQLEDDQGNLRDYLIDLDFRGTRTMILAAPNEERMVTELQPVWANYPYKAALRFFNYGAVQALNLRWMRYESASEVICTIHLVEALQELPVTLNGLQIDAGSVTLPAFGPLASGDYLEYWGEGPVRVFNSKGSLLRTIPVASAPMLGVGMPRVQVRSSQPARILWTSILYGNAP